MFDQIPAPFQYLLLGQTAFIVTILALWIKNRIDARRERAGVLADELGKLGLARLAEPIREYSQGDYSEAIEGFASLAKEIKAGGGIALLEEAVEKVVKHYAAANATKARALIDLLQSGRALKDAKGVVD